VHQLVNKKNFDNAIMFTIILIYIILGFYTDSSMTKINQNAVPHNVNDIRPERNTTM
jgi:hypothetical protein